MRMRVLVFAAIGVAGCGATSDGVDEVYYTQTVVLGQNEDGTPRVIQRTVSRSEQLAEQRARTAEAGLPIGSSEQALHGLHTPADYCDSSWFRIFDQNNWTGNEICFKSYYVSGDGYFGYADLSQYCLNPECTSSWWAKPSTYWVPNSVYNGTGYFQDSGGGQEWFTCTVGGVTDCATAHHCGGHCFNARYVFLAYGY